LVVGRRDALERDGLSAERATWATVPPRPGDAVLVQMRAHARPHGATIDELGADKSTFRLRFDEPTPGVTPGQLCVLYQDDEVLGSGTIIE
jgi:tRNA-specific 2-thiouridylase